MTGTENYLVKAKELLKDYGNDFKKLFSSELQKATFKIKKQRKKIGNLTLIKFFIPEMNPEFAKQVVYRDELNFYIDLFQEFLNRFNYQYQLEIAKKLFGICFGIEEVYKQKKDTEGFDKIVYKFVELLRKKIKSRSFLDEENEFEEFQTYYLKIVYISPFSKEEEKLLQNILEKLVKIIG